MTIKLCVTESGNYYLTKNDLIALKSIEPTFFKSIPELLCSLHNLEKYFNRTNNALPAKRYIVKEYIVAEVNTFEELKNLINTHPELFI